MRNTHNSGTTGVIATKFCKFFSANYEFCQQSFEFLSVSRENKLLGSATKTIISNQDDALGLHKQQTQLGCATLQQLGRKIGKKGVVLFTLCLEDSAQQHSLQHPQDCQCTTEVPEELQQDSSDKDPFSQMLPEQGKTVPPTNVGASHLYQQPMATLHAAAGQEATPQPSWGHLWSKFCSRSRESRTGRSTTTKRAPDPQNKTPLAATQ